MKASTYWISVICGLPFLFLVVIFGLDPLLSFVAPKPGFTYMLTDRGWFSVLGFYFVGSLVLFFVMKIRKEEYERRLEVFIDKTGLTAIEADEYLRRRQRYTQQPTYKYLHAYLNGKPVPFASSCSTPESFKVEKERQRLEQERHEAERRAAAELERLKRDKSVVYFIGNRDEGLVKIGYTTSLGKRLKTIQTSSPFPVNLLHAEPGTLDDERAMHQRFAHLRKSGEWFWLRPAIEEYIESQRRVSNNYADLDAELAVIYSFLI